MQQADSAGQTWSADAQAQAVVLECVDRLLDYLRHNSQFGSPADEPSVHAAEALARGCALARASVTTLRSGDRGAIGILARAAWECSLTGAYLATGGKKTLIRVQVERISQDADLLQADQSQARAFRQRRDDLHGAERSRQIAEGGRDPYDESPVSIPRLTVERLAREAGPLLERATGEPADLMTSYRRFYPVTSLGHGYPCGTVDAPRADNCWQGRTPWLETHRPIAVATDLLAALAWLVNGHVGTHGRHLDGLRRELVEAMEADAE